VEESSHKKSITFKPEDQNKIVSLKELGFSIKSQLGRPSTLVNASKVTRFTYILRGNILTNEEIEQINNLNEFSAKFKKLNELGVSLEFDKVEHKIFRSNLQTIDFNFDRILSELLLLFYANGTSSENTVPKFTQKIAEKNSIGYDMKINPMMYELIVKKFLTDYAIGMRAAEVWTRNYQATGGYLIVREDGELICYHFYFTKKFEDYLFKNTKFETPDPVKHDFGYIYSEDGIQKIKLNLQVRFIK
jgi:type II restriction enzyme